MKFEDQLVKYTRRDVILYSLGIGAKELKFAFEGGR